MAQTSRYLKTGELLAILSDLWRGRDTGTLVLQREATTKFLYFQDGQVIFAASNAPEDKFTQILIDQGRLTVDQVNLATQKRESRTLGRTLVDLGFLSSEDLLDALIAQVQRIALSVAIWPSGTSSFKPNVLPPGVAKLPITTGRLVLDTASSVPDRAWVGQTLGGLESVLKIASSEKDAIREMSLTAEESRILDAVDGRRSIREICEQVGLDSFSGAKFLLGLFFLQLAHRKEVLTPMTHGDDGKVDLSFLDEVVPTAHGSAKRAGTPTPPPPPEPVPVPTAFEAPEPAPRSLFEAAPPAPDDQPEPEEEPASPEAPTPSPFTFLAPEEPPREASFSEPEPGLTTPILDMAPRPETPSDLPVGNVADLLLPPPKQPPPPRPLPRKSYGKLALAAAAILVVAGGALGGWWYLNRKPAKSAAAHPSAEEPPKPSQAKPVPKPSVPAPSNSASPLQSAPANPLPPPPDDAAAKPVQVPVAPPAAPAPKTPSPAPVAPLGSGARDLLQAGKYPEAARAFQSELKGTKAAFTIDVEIACQPETIQKGFAASQGNSAYMVVPYNFRGRNCYRVLWGTYATQKEAESALQKIPAHFLGDQHPPKVVPWSAVRP